MAGMGAPKRQRIRRVALGDMRHKIDIKTPAITPINDDGVDFDRNFATFKTVYAYIETVSGEEVFDGTNLRKFVTHNIVIRTISTLTEEFWIFYKGNAYDIVDIETYDERGLFMKLRCLKRGDQNKPVNKA